MNPGPYPHPNGKPLDGFESPASNRAQRRQNYGSGGHPDSLSSRRARRQYARLIAQREAS